ncbi:MAG: hypothetical protein AAF909_15685, partial [Pseudomonadota bacterium]
EAARRDPSLRDAAASRAAHSANFGATQPARRAPNHQDDPPEAPNETTDIGTLQALPQEARSVNPLNPGSNDAPGSEPMALREQLEPQGVSPDETTLLTPRLRHVLGLPEDFRYGDDVIDDARVLMRLGESSYEAATRSAKRFAAAQKRLERESAALREAAAAQGDPTAYLSETDRRAINVLALGREARAALPRRDAELDAEAAQVFDALQEVVEARITPAAELLVSRLHRSRKRLLAIDARMQEIVGRAPADLVDDLLAGALSGQLGGPRQAFSPREEALAEGRGFAALRAEYEALTQESARVAGRAVAIASALGAPAQYGDPIGPAIEPFFAIQRKTEGQRGEMRQALWLAASAAEAMARAERASNPTERLSLLAEASERQAEASRRRLRAEQTDWARFYGDYVEPALLGADLATAVAWGPTTALARQVATRAAGLGARIGANRATALLVTAALLAAPSDAEGVPRARVSRLLRLSDDALAKQVDLGQLEHIQGRLHHPLSFGVVSKPLTTGRKPLLSKKATRTMSQSKLVEILKAFQADPKLMAQAVALIGADGKTPLRQLSRLSQKGKVLKADGSVAAAARTQSLIKARAFHSRVITPVQITLQRQATDAFYLEARTRALKANPRLKEADLTVEKLLARPGEREHYLAEVMEADIRTLEALGVAADQAEALV